VCAHVVDPVAKASDEFAGAVVCDLFRVANFELVEHWDLGQAIPSTSASGNSMVSRLYQGNQGQQ